jgi:acylphosphatase
MQQRIKRYNITIRDHVQLLGYRGQIELIGRDLGLHGVVFNAPDGSVKVVAEGEESVFDVFLDDLKRIRQGVDIEAREVSMDIDLPVTFSRVATDEQLEQMKRFDKAIELLGRVDGNTHSLVEGQNTMVESLNTLVKGQNTLVESQKSLVDGQSKVLTVLEKIEARLK